MVNQVASSPQHVLRVTRSKAQAKQRYDQMSRFYDVFEGVFEQRFRNLALKRVDLTRGEAVLEIGFGTGHCLKQMAESVGEEGRVCGIDISPGMLAASRRRLEKAGLSHRVALICDDALHLPYPAGWFDAVFTSFALELFDTPEIPMLLAEIQRVLKPCGRLGVVGMSKAGGVSPMLSLYEWLHRLFPQTIDCRPIYVAQSIQDAGFAIRSRERVNIWGLPGEIVIGVKPDSTA